jgi:hypothetical protein
LVNQFINNIQVTPGQLNSCEKLIVIPQMLLASKFIPMNQTLIEDYMVQATNCLTMPQEGVPNMI